MNRFFKLWLPAFSLGLCLSTPLLAAEPTVVYVHGFALSFSPQATLDCQDQATCPDYWGAQDTEYPVVHVGYDGRLNPLRFGEGRGLTQILSVLNKYCRRDEGKSCRIVNHSMGGLLTGYVVDKYNRSNTYNIEYVSSIVSAENGSELATAGNVVLGALGPLAVGLSYLLDNFPDASRLLAVPAARGSYDHNRNNGVQFYHIAGEVSLSPMDPRRWILRGDHDTVVSMHSTCGYRNVKKFTRCGGQTITTGALWWKKRKTYVPYSGHHAHPRHHHGGVNVTHNAFRDLPEYTNSSL